MGESENFKRDIFVILLLNLITFTSLIFRCINIDVPTGLWHDEFYSFYAANQSFPFGIIEWLNQNDVHFPLYFLVLHIWMVLFGNCDISLRFCSVIFGVLNIPVIYFAGKELNSYKTGLLAATFVGINSFLIYYSQEVRLYSLLTFLISFSILFALKIIKNANFKNLLLLMITNILIIFTYPIGIAFVGIEILLFGVYFCLKQKAQLIKFLSSQILIPLSLFLLYLPFFLKQVQTKNNQFIFSTNFNFSNSYLYLQNWFSPVIDGLYCNFTNYLSLVNLKDINFYIFTSIPIIIAFIGLIKVLYTKSIARIILLVIFLFVSFEISLGLLHKVCIVSRYTIIILPVLLLIVAYGLLSIKTKFLSNILIFSYIFINLFHMFFYHGSVFRRYRTMGLNVPVLIIMKKINLNSNDIVLFSEGDELIRRYYLPEYGSVLKFSAYQKPPFNEKTISSYFKNNISTKLQEGRYFTVIRNANLFRMSEDQVSHIASQNESYAKEQLQNPIANKILNDLEKIAQKNYKKVYSENTGNWIINIYQNN